MSITKKTKVTLISENNSKNDPAYPYEVNLKDVYVKWIDTTGNLDSIKKSKFKLPKWRGSHWFSHLTISSGKEDRKNVSRSWFQIIAVAERYSIKQFLSLGYWESPALDPTARGEIAKGFIGADILK